MNGIHCKGCTDCCTKTILPINDYELKKLHKATGLAPDKIVRFYSFDHVDWPKDNEDWVELRQGRRLMALRQQQGRCLFLKKGKCIVYKDRPRVCRIFPVDYFFSDDLAEATAEVQERLDSCKASVDHPLEKLEALEKIALALMKTDLSYQAKVAQWNDENPRGTIKEYLAFITK